MAENTALNSVLYPKNASTVATGMFDPQNALALSDTREIVEDFVLDFCGLQKIKEGNAIKTKRFAKPRFTYEFARYVMDNIYVKINRVTGRTTFDDDDILCYNIITSDSMSDWFATEGMDNLISDRVWEKIIEYSINKIDEKTGKSIEKTNLWYTKYKISWDYDGQVNKDMIDIVKKEFSHLKNENYNQDIILRDISWAIIHFVHAGMNRSLNATTLNHEKVIYKESVVNNVDANSGRSESRLDGLKQLVRNLTGGK